MYSGCNLTQEVDSRSHAVSHNSEPLPRGELFGTYQHKRGSFKGLHFILTFSFFLLCGVFLDISESIASET